MKATLTFDLPEERGMVIGRIRCCQEFLKLPVTDDEELASKSLVELEALFRELDRSVRGRMRADLHRTTMTPRKIANWLRRHNPRFGGASPIELICNTGSTGARRVTYELEQLEQGTTSSANKILKFRKP